MKMMIYSGVTIQWFNNQQDQDQDQDFEERVSRRLEANTPSLENHNFGTVYVSL